MSNSMQHWNGNQVCAIDTETTGLDPSWNEIVQICILPLDSNFRPRRDVLPFYLNLQPDYPDRISGEAMRINGLDPIKLINEGIDKEKAKDLLVEWTNKLGLPFTKLAATRKRIIPLGQNYAFDKGFILKWLGITLYEELFDYHYKDTMIAAEYLNDRAAMHGEKVPFSKVNLNWLATRLNVHIEKAHDALSDCVTTAETYRLLTSQGVIA